MPLWLFSSSCPLGMDQGREESPWPRDWGHSCISFTSPGGERHVMPAVGLGKNVDPKLIHSLMNAPLFFSLTPYKRSYFVEKSLLKLVWSLSSEGKCRINCWLSSFGKSWILPWAQVGRWLGPAASWAAAEKTAGGIGRGPRLASQAGGCWMKLKFSAVLDPAHPAVHLPPGYNTSPLGSWCVMSRQDCQDSLMQT